MAKKSSKSVRKKRKSATVFFNSCSKIAAEKYFSNLYKLAELSGCEKACQLLSKVDKRNLYFSRVHFCRPKVKEGTPIDKSVAKFIGDQIRNICETPLVIFVPGKPMVSIHEACTVYSFIKFLENFYEGSSGDKLREAFKPLLLVYDTLENPFHTLYEWYNNVLASFNTCNRACFGIDHTTELRHYPTVGVYNVVHLVHHWPSKDRIKIDNKYRPIYRLGWPIWTGEMDYLTIDSRIVKDLYDGNKPVLKIYIQNHAFIRFHERTMPLMRSFVNLSMMISWTHSNVEIFKGRILIPFKYFGIKLGYFLSEIIDEKLVVKTFLFITHHHTPEGSKLESISGLSKKEISYWRIDKVETFLSSNIKEDSLMNELFEKAGLQNLFQLRTVEPQKLDRDNYSWDSIEEYILKGQQELCDDWESAESPDPKREVQLS
ncbi:MAG: hypothetical protein ACERIH_06920 [Labilibaculum antarcticum]